jgi:hypothetical protein
MTADAPPAPCFRPGSRFIVTYYHAGMGRKHSATVPARVVRRVEGHWRTGEWFEVMFKAPAYGLPETWLTVNRRGNEPHGLARLATIEE